VGSSKATAKPTERPEGERRSLDPAVAALLDHIAEDIVFMVEGDIIRHSL